MNKYTNYPNEKSPLNHEGNDSLIRPATAADISYRAYKSTCLGKSNPALVLLARCSLPKTGVRLYFSGDNGIKNQFVLMEQLPNIGFPMEIFYHANYTTGVQAGELPDFITIKDAFGAHRVKVEVFD